VRAKTPFSNTETRSSKRAGPASLQAAPSNTLPQLNFEASSDGLMFITPPKWGVNDNGIVGYGRFVK